MLVTVAETTGWASAYAAVNQHIAQRSPAALARSAEAGAEKADELITAEMNRSKSGIQWSSLPNRSSSPSEFPAEQSGELVDNMVVSSLPGYPGVGRAALVATSPQAWFMEFGFMTKDGGFHIRPFMRPGVDKFRPQILEAMRNAA